MKTLLDIYNKHKVGDWPDKGSTHSYIEVYEEILAPYRHTAKNILEIGLMSGESLRMWTEYFDGKVYGIDCSETPIDGLADLRPIIAEGKHNIFILDAEDPAAIKKALKGIKFDIVFEDAGHNIEQQITIYNTLKPHMKKGGVYIIEDVQDLDATRHLFEDIDPKKSATIIDLRNVKNRYDDVIVLIQDK